MRGIRQYFLILKINIIADNNSYSMIPIYQERKGQLKIIGVSLSTWENEVILICNAYIISKKI